MSDQAKVNEEKVLNETDGFSEKEKAANRPGTEKRDWVEEAYKCFIKDAGDIDPTDPVKAVEAYFQKNATDELKARCKAEGKEAALCWEFIKAVARKALGGRNGHIDPGVVYAIAMHYFEDVPVNWDGQTGKVSHTPRASAKVEKTKKAKKVEKTKKAKKAKRPEIPKSAQPKPEALPTGTKPKKAKARFEQGFFFEMLEMQPDGPNKDEPSSPQASAGASGEEIAMEPSSLPASTSSTESEVQ